MDAKLQALKGEIASALYDVAAERSVVLPADVEVALERPKREGQGDWSTNAAMKLAKLFGMQPMDLAEAIKQKLSASDVSSIEIARPGFINFTLGSRWTVDVIKEILSKREEYGRNENGRGRRVQVEFVSANPTGPLHLGHGRNAAVGDALARMLEFSGWSVEREYYINDAGVQMEKLALSARSRYFDLLGRGEEAPFPEDGYPGGYMDDVARSIIDEHGDRYLTLPLEQSLEFFRDVSRDKILKMIEKDLSDFAVRFDVWFSERSLYDGDLTDRTRQILTKNGYVYEQDGAVWFRSTAFGDDKDRVLVKNDGVPTYFTSDIAYMQDKIERGYDLIIYVWGADHHGYVPRLRSAGSALGIDDGKLCFLLIQFVSLLRNGVPVAMSKRAGTFVTLREIIDEVGSDAARFSFLNRKCDSHLEFDLEVAKKTSSENPVYYVQYAHARSCSILREAQGRGVQPPSVDDVDLDVLDSPSELKLIKELSRFPEEVARAANDLEPHKIVFYAIDLAEAFHIFYNTHKVLGEEKRTMDARLLLVEASRIVIANALRLVGVNAPERM